MSHPVSRRELIATASAAAALGAAASLPITIANASGGLNLTMTALMKRMGFFEAFGLKPNLMSIADGSKMVGGVLSGAVDASFMSGFGQLFPAIERGGDLKIIGGGALTPTIALFTGKPYVRSLKDLEGRTVGTGSPGALVHQLTVTLLHKYNVDISKVRFVNIGSSADVFRAVSMGTVDAGPGASALIDDTAKYHVRLIPHGNMSAELRGYTFQGAWTSDRKIRSERDLLVRGLAAQAKLYRFVQTDAAKGPFIAARRSVFPNAPESDHEAEWKFISTYKPFDVDLVLRPDQLDYIQKLNVAYKVQNRMLPFRQVADMSLAADAIRLLQKSR